MDVKRSLAGLLLLLSVTAAPPFADAQTTGKLVGRPVAEVLRELQANGERIIFASALVPPELRVKTEPRATRPLEIAREVLEAHGLTLKDGPGNTWLVVRSTRTTPPPVERGKQPGAAPSRRQTVSEEAPGQTAIRIEEQVDVTDRLGDLSRQPSVYKVDPVQVLETAGSFDNLFQVLPMLPGAVATNDEEGKLAVRGGGPEHNVVVFDGVQIYSPQRAGDFGASFVNPAVTAGVAFDASGLDARHGGRLSSVTVLETRNGNSARRLALSGSLGLTSGDMLAEGRMPGTRSGSWWVAARGTYYKFVSDRFRDGATPGFADLQFKLHVRPTTRTELSLSGLAGIEGMARLTPLPEDPLLEGIYPDAVREDIEGDNRLVALNLRWTPGLRLTTLTTATLYSSGSRYYDNLGKDTKPFDRNVRVADVAVRQRASMALSPRHLVDVGVEARRLRTSWAMSGSTFSPHARTVGPDTWGGGLESYEPIDSRLNKTLLSAWVQDRVQLGGGIAIEPGARMDWNSFTSEAALQPRLRLTKTLGGTVLWTGLAWQAQTPGHETMQQGYSYFDLTGPEASALRNERSRQIVVGLAREVGSTTIRIEAYRRAFDRLLVQRQETDAERELRLSGYVLPPDFPTDSAIVEHRPTVQPESTGTGRATGLEILLQRARGRVTGWVSYTLSKADRDLYGRTAPFDFDRRQGAAIAMNFQLTSKVRLSATSQYATGFALTPLHPEPVFPQESQIFPVPVRPFSPARGSDGMLLLRRDPNKPLRLSLLNSTRAPAYARTDVRASFAVTPWLEIYGEVINVFNRENFHPRTEYRPGAFTQYQIAPSLPLLPTYGLRVKF
jgi:hypothetical protein